MGLASGKLTISHVEEKHKADATAEVDLDASHPVNAAQPITSKSNVAAEPAAHGDEVVVTTTAATATENGPNGTVTAADQHTTSPTDVEKKEDKPTKKTKNPLVWIQRRLSKRHSNSKKATTDKAAGEEEEDATVTSSEKKDETQPIPSDSTEPSTAVVLTSPAEDIQIVDTASSLVDQVLNTALVQQLPDASVESSIPEVIPPASDTVEHEPSTPTAHSEEPEQAAAPPAEVYPTEQAVECAPTEEQSQTHHAVFVEEATSVAVQEELVNGIVEEHAESELAQETEQPQPEEEEKEKEEEQEEKQTVEENMTDAVLDTNNTNAECAEQEPEPEEQEQHQHTEDVIEESAAHQIVEDQQEPVKHLDDSMTAKLSSLELTNGHSEDHVVTNGEASSEVVVNGN